MDHYQLLDENTRTERLFGWDNNNSKKITPKFRIISRPIEKRMFNGTWKEEKNPVWFVVREHTHKWPNKYYGSRVEAEEAAWEAQDHAEQHDLAIDLRRELDKIHRAESGQPRATEKQVMMMKKLIGEKRHIMAGEKIGPTELPELQAMSKKEASFYIENMEENEK